MRECDEISSIFTKVAPSYVLRNTFVFSSVESQGQVALAGADHPTLTTSNHVTNTVLTVTLTLSYVIFTSEMLGWNLKSGLIDRAVVDDFVIRCTSGYVFDLN